MKTEFILLEETKKFTGIANFLTNLGLERREIFLFDEYDKGLEGKFSEELFVGSNLGLLIFQTNLVGDEQWNLLCEIVPRHTAKAQFIVGKETCGIFIAPKIDINIGMTFFGCMTSVPYVYQGQKMRLTIIPLTIRQFCELLLYHSEQKLTLKKFRELLEMIKNLKDDKNVIDGEERLKRTPAVIDNWKKGLK